MSTSLSVYLVFGWKIPNPPKDYEFWNEDANYVVELVEPMGGSTEACVVYARGSSIRVVDDRDGYEIDDLAICIPNDLPATDDFLLQLSKVPDTLRPQNNNTQPCWILWSCIG